MINNIENTLLRPYKSIGLVSGSKHMHFYNAGTKNYIAVPTNHSYKIYD